MDVSDTEELHRTLVLQAIKVPVWLYGMPESWWDVYFDRVDQFIIYPRWIVV